MALATRNSDDPKLATLALSIGPNASAGAVSRVVEHSEVVVLATPWAAVRDMPGVEADWSGKILIDCTNPLNYTGANNMANPVYPEGRPVMFVCGDDAAAKPTVLQLVAELGFDAVDAGELKVARLLEPLAMLWIHLAMRQGLGREIAFALLRRAGPAG